ncbi:MAG: hypothetical protein Q8M29_15740 [Bacteroidota bacterium]|nr:hypothetical protein [Bacteroidota bacterium]
MIKFFDIKPGEVIADVGAAEGYHEGALSLLYDSLVAADSNRINVIADSLLPAITKLTDQYVVYEAWLKNIGLKWKKTGRHTEAINILKACTKLFPQSAQNYALLGEVYLENKQQDLAGICFDKACNMGVESKFCSKKNKK